MKTWFQPIRAQATPAGVAAGILLSTAKGFGLSAPLELAFIGALGAYCVYVVDHAKGTQGKRFSPVQRIGVQCPVTVATATILILTWRAPSIRLIPVLVYMALSVAYVFPILPGHKRLQDLPRLRTICIVLGWALSPVLLASLPLNQAFVLWSLAWAGTLLPAVLWHDAASKDEDTQAGRPTWAGLQPLTRLKTISMISLILSTGLFAFLSPLLVVTPIITLLALLRDPLRSVAYLDELLLWPLISLLII